VCSSDLQSAFPFKLSIGENLHSSLTPLQSKDSGVANKDLSFQLDLLFFQGLR
jgi:hypothetical protein